MFKEIFISCFHWLAFAIMTIMTLFGQENVMHAGLICLPNGEHGKIVKKNTLKIGEAVRMQHELKKSMYGLCLKILAWIITDCNT